MKQRQCRDVAHAPSICELVIDSHGGGKAKPRTFVRGFRTCFSELAVLLVLLTALLLLTGLLLATLLLLAGLLLATLLLLAGLLLATLLLATLLLLAGLLVGILVHRISSHILIGSPLRSLVFHGKSQSAANAFVPIFTLKQCVWNLPACFEFPCK
jgi:hypothetical protein